MLQIRCDQRKTVSRRKWVIPDCHSCQHKVSVAKFDAAVAVELLYVSIMRADFDEKGRRQQIINSSQIFCRLWLHFSKLCNKGGKFHFD